ncbi:Diaminohydroxyphosphoribosylaminopyrimidine deaminase / 5-amino-6-(5-phosphoribosylamino)uracil reductase [Thioalkalivibrio nitratireducens DSM 14787]|uniref:Riboflavin biosynthesis protein RibD n=1 Tax=Thioalkalivibrio nitratireducens (strain DSM 14787 / UNIQEM 213 / ALEN2) TaxID=1255043 RepID=L0DY37_THIND|nr:bifunctional diaminohydroxyphosphoribosylaminopyrimidine deaminase/5-amino-6-(5-phosphoribosylamino)uracil reductase RibD [Thioalkalivibrio nitratireducens]AGA34514.1 Diaminohydroxyphosphoribosylaminopyrimidine deaminase / 5-amino-6-(5-phosphoribosylamino)uracil reductase [Thioalkalivibrio nitratireducens DSM 14787]
MSDERFMARALQLAHLGLYTTDPNPRVGSVAVRDGAIIGEGVHWRAGEPHAEIHALRAAGERARGATVYVTLEPCSHHGRTPPCADALIAAGVARVVIAMQDPNPHVAGRGVERLRAAGIEVRSGMLEFEARRLNPGFVRRMQSGRPWVRVKLASSLDGRTAMASGDSRWITGPAARRDVQHWRARAGAILTGSGTVLADDPRLTVRLTPAELLADDGHAPDRYPELADAAPRHPPRVVIDSRLQTPRSARLFDDEGPVVVFTTAERAASDKARDLRLRGAEVEAAPERDDGQLDLGAVLDQLGEREVNELHVEAGAGLAGALARCGLVDEWLLYLAPCLMGSGARPLLDWPLQHMDERAELDLFACDRVGDALRLRAWPLPPV